MTAVDAVEESYRRIAERDDDAVWISLVPYDEAYERAATVDPALPLAGLTFSVKDNLDVAGMETTAACPEFGYVAAATAEAVRRAEAAGAVLVGKTNLDQFATGLSGARSPYGVVRSVEDPELVSGGSSSGSAVSVAAGLVSFSIGTDTAGSGRVPAALNGVAGLKPSIGLVSTRGLVPACRSLDCVSVFAPTVAEGARVLAVLAGYDAADPWSRRLPVPPATPLPVALPGLRLGVPAESPGWGARGEREAWKAYCAGLAEAGVDLVPVPMAPFWEAGQLLYDGPWLAERLSGVADFVSRRPGALLPVTRAILEAGAGYGGVETFQAMDRLQRLGREVEQVLAGVDALLTPTVCETFTVEEMLADPVTLNSRLGTFTSFSNLLDLCAVAVPAGRTRTGLPFGVTVHAGHGQDARAAAIAQALDGGSASPDVAEGQVRLAVVGAHLSGMPLHGELLACEAVLESRTRTAPSYRLHALDGGPPARPGLERVSHGGASIEVEVYQLPLGRLGDLLATVPAPLGLGRVSLGEGEEVVGFICEPAGLVGATDITSYGGWRAYLADA